MHPEIKSDKPGRCPKCGMKLVKMSEVNDITIRQSNNIQSYAPLIVIMSLTILTVAAISFRELLMESFRWQEVMINFMAGFFLVFSGFKLIDLSGFAQGYSTYDLLAQKWFRYGYIYPFLELILGLLYAMHFVPPIILWMTFILMAFSGIGVAIKVAKHERFQCACLGTFLKVPLTSVTLIEDFGMAAMALLMIYLR